MIILNSPLSLLAQIPDFWLGVFTLPVAVVALGLIALIGLGGWKAAEDWAERRWSRSHVDVQVDDGVAWVTHLGNRHNITALVAAAPHVLIVKLGFGSQLILTRGTQKIPRSPFTAFERAIAPRIEDLHASLAQTKDQL